MNEQKKINFITIKKPVMTYEELFDQLYEIAEVKKQEIEEKETKDEPLKALNFFKPKRLKERYMQEFSKIAKCLLVTENPDRDILAYLCSHRTADEMNSNELFNRLFEAARCKDDEFFFTYAHIDKIYHGSTPFNGTLNWRLAQPFAKEFKNLAAYLMLPDSFDPGLSNYLLDHFRWVVPIEKREGMYVTRPRIYILPYSSLNDM